MTTKEITENVRQIKRRFFAMRNGSIGQQMRSLGADYRINFGLNIPQIAAIARDFPADTDLADFLWHNATTRESMIIAPMLHPPQTMTQEKAEQWIAESPTVEVTDALCHRLLRQLPFAKNMALEILKSSEPKPMTRYAAIRLLYHLLTEKTASEFRPVAQAEAESGLDTALVARMLVSEIDFILEDLENNKVQ